MGIDPIDLLEPRQLTSSERFTASQKTADIKPGVFEAVRAAASSEFLMSSALRHFELSSFEPDEDFELTKPLLDELTDGLPDDFISQFESASSLEQARAIRSQSLALRESRDKLDQLGFSGFALRLGALVLDPVAVGLSLATEGAASNFIYGGRIARMNRFVRAGLIFGAVEGVLEAGLVATDPERSSKDILYAMVGGALLGGGITALRRAPGQAAAEAANVRPLRGGPRRADPASIAGANSPEVQEFMRTGVNPFDSRMKDLAREIEFRDVLESGVDLTDNGKKYFANQLDPTITKKQFERLVDGLELSPEELATIEPQLTMRGLSRSSAGNASGQGPPASGVTTNALQFDSVPIDAPFSTLGKARIDMIGQLKQDPQPGVRRMATMLAEDPFPNADGTPNILSASEFVTLNTRVREASFERGVLTALADWGKRNGRNLFNGFKKEKEFLELATRAVRRNPGVLTDDASVNAVAKVLRDEQAQMLRMAKEAGVRGFSDIPESPTYIMRVAAFNKIDNAVNQFGMDKVRRFVRNSLMSGSEDLTEDQAEKLGKAWLGHHIHHRFETEISKAQMFSVDKSDELRRILRDNLSPGEISDDSIEEIIKKTAPRGGGSPRTRRRMDIDELYGEDIFDDAGNKLGRLDFEDLLENDARKLFTAYNRQVHGEIAMRKVLEAFAEPGEAPPSTFEALVKRLEKEAADLGRDPKGFQTAIDKLDTLQKVVRGIPITRNDTASDVMRWLRSYNYLRVGGQFGFAQIPELGQILFNPRVTMQGIPAYGQIFNRARSGRMSNEILDELEHLFALGTDWLRDHPVTRFEDFGSSSTQLGKLDETLQRAQRTVSVASFLQPVNTALQRVSGINAVQKWVNIASSGRPMSKKRLASMALTEAEGDRILGQIRKHVVTENGLFGRRAKRINLSAWDDQEAASKFTTALFKWSHRAIQENDIGNFAQWMTTDMGRLITQFRPFVLNAYSKQFLFSLHMRDWEALNAVAMSTMLGGLVYTGQQFANSIGRPDQDAFLQERLTFDKIAASAFQRSGFGSVAPPIVDSILPVLGFDPMFQFGRTSQMASDILFGNPSVDLLNRAQRGAQGLIAPIVQPDEEFTQAGLRNAFQILPFSNILGARNMFEAVAQDLPER